MRHKLATLVGALAMLSTVFLFGGAAQAQTYPPGTSVPACVVGDVNAGTVHVGDTVKFTLCGNFAPGATVSITVNGTTVPITKTPANGLVSVTIKVVSNTVLAVEDPVNVTAVCGINSVTASGASAAGGNASAKGTFNLVCTTTNTTANPGGLAFTGANVLRAVLIALALIVVGTLVVYFQRRRRQTI